MKFNFQFSNLCGCVYRHGNLAYTSDGNRLITPVGNRITVYDLVNHTSQTLRVQMHHNIRCLALSPDDKLLVTVDTHGHCLIINFLKGMTLATMKFKEPNVFCCKFSPDSRLLAVCHGTWISVWRTPSMIIEWKPMILQCKFRGHYNDVLCLDWTKDSLFLVSGSKDMSCRIHCVDKKKPFQSQALTGHSSYVVACYFGNDNKLYSLTRDGFIYKWIPGATPKMHAKYGTDRSVENGANGRKVRKKLPLLMYAKYAPYGKHRLHIKGKENEAINCAAFYRFGSNKKGEDGNESGMAGVVGNDLLVIGLSNGKFCLYAMPKFKLIHALTISNAALSTCVVNPTGDWLALASSKMGQLFVWEWRSETYVMKQQSHFFNVNCIAFSGDGQLIASGGMDGKLKIWNANNGFCFITFFDHTAPITKVRFAKNNVLVITASLDGTVRVYDLIRYTNFRTLKPPTKDEYNRYMNDQIDKSRQDGEEAKVDHHDGLPMMNARFISLAVDESAEIICAGSEDPFNIFVWNLRTGKCLDILHGHDGPVSALAISCNNQLASGSWDGTVRLWDIYNPNTATEIVDIHSEVLDLDYRKDGEELALCTLNGQINCVDCEEGKVVRSYSVKKDVLGGMNRSDKYNINKSQNQSLKNHYTCIKYSADGSCLLAGGNSKYIGFYFINKQSLLLLSRYVTCINKDYDGILENVNHSNYVKRLGIYLDPRDGHMAGPESITTGGTNDDLILTSKEKHLRKDIIKMKRLNLPGVKMTDYSSRNELNMILTKDVAFAPTNAMFAAATTDGLMLYSQESMLRVLNYKLDRFNPIDLDIYITPENIEIELKKCVREWYGRSGAKQEKEEKKEETKNSLSVVKKDGNAANGSSFGRTLVMALKFNNLELIKKVMEYVPLEMIELVIQSLPLKYVENVLNVICENIDKTQFLQFYLIWVNKIFVVHGTYISKHFNVLLPCLRLLHKNINQVYRELSPIAESNVFKLQFMSSFHVKNELGNSDDADVEMQGDDNELTEFGRKKLDLNIIEEKKIALTNPKGEFEPIPFKAPVDDPFASL